MGQQGPYVATKSTRKGLPPQSLVVEEHEAGVDEFGDDLGIVCPAQGLPE